MRQLSALYMILRISVAYYFFFYTEYIDFIKSVIGLVTFAERNYCEHCFIEYSIVEPITLPVSSLMYVKSSTIAKPVHDSVGKPAHACFDILKLSE